MATDTARLDAICAQFDKETAAGLSDGAILLDDTQRFLQRFVAYPSIHAAVAHTLWIVHSHAMHAWASTPRIAFLSPEPGSGKTRALEITELLVPRPLLSVSQTSAYIFRKISSEDGSPTILYDEIDTVFGPKAKGDHEDIRAVLNSGHRPGAVAGRCVVRGKIVETEELPTYCAVAMAGLGWLPDSLLTRSVIIRMRRRAPHESVEPFRRRTHGTAGEALQVRLSSWCRKHGDRLAAAVPSMPMGIEDRNADVWEALLAIADMAGGEWPAKARVSAVTLVTDAKGGTQSLGIRLLADLKIIFSGVSQLATTEVINRLCALDESPWGDMKGTRLDSRRLAYFLKEYEVKSRTIRTGNTTIKGYSAAELHDAWLRYLPPSPMDAAKTAIADAAKSEVELIIEETRPSPLVEVTSVTNTASTKCLRCGGEGCKWCRWPRPLAPEAYAS